MTSLLWPGDERAGDLLSDAAVLVAMAVVEEAWLEALVAVEVAPPDAGGVRLSELVGDGDVVGVAADAEGTGTPVVPLVGLLRDRLAGRHPSAALWLHRGLTSQDVLDTGLVLCLRDVFDRQREELRAQVQALTGLARWHRATPMTGRTLTQHAVPITFGLKAATWLEALLDAAEDVETVGVRWPVQIGGAAGTLAAPAELARLAGLEDPPAVAVDLVRRTASALGLRAGPPWQTARAPLTRAGDALVRCTDGYGRIADDVLVLARPEIGELHEPAARDGRPRGGSSTMPQKANPVLATLMRRAALSAPALGAQLHLAAAASVDERSPGAWHAEWAALQLLGRRTLVAASQATELVAGLHVDQERMRSTLEAAGGGLLAERRALAELFPGAEPAVTRDEDPTSYLGAADALVDAVLRRAAAYLGEAS
ncbi:MAG TPA: lyase family protein [Kineosporiaceae bacterium]|nr:lyase family protein [Kineosporiaceae bacterium]